MAKDIPKVPFTKADLYGLVNRDLNALKPQAPAPAGLDKYAALRQAIRTRKLMPGAPSGRPKAL